MKFHCPKCGHVDEVADDLPATCLCDPKSPFVQPPILCHVGQRPTHAPPAPPPGVGSRIRRKLGCGCGELPFQQWNERGPEWCRDHSGEIALRIADAPKARTSLRAAMIFVRDAIAEAEEAAAGATL